LYLEAEIISLVIYYPLIFLVTLYRLIMNRHKNNVLMLRKQKQELSAKFVNSSAGFRLTCKHSSDSCIESS